MSIISILENVASSVIFFILILHIVGEVRGLRLLHM